MKDISNLEIIQINTIDGQLVALASYKDNRVNDLNNGYSTIHIPVNIRRIQLSVRGHMLVDQSVREESVAVES